MLNSILLHSRCTCSQNVNANMCINSRSKGGHIKFIVHALFYKPSSKYMTKIAAVDEHVFKLKVLKLYMDSSFLHHFFFQETTRHRGIDLLETL